MAEARQTPWHLWVIGVVSLLWNAVGAFDYVMTETRNPDYMAQFTQEQVAYFTGFPVWVVFFWAIGVWGAVLGSVLLLLRREWAEPMFWFSLAGMIGTSVYTFLITGPQAVAAMGTMGIVFSAVVLVVGVLLALYARAMRRRGVLV